MLDKAKTEIQVLPHESAKIFRSVADPSPVPTATREQYDLRVLGRYTHASATGVFAQRRVLAEGKWNYFTFGMLFFAAMVRRLVTGATPLVRDLGP